MLIKRRKTHYLLFENWMVFHLNKLESTSPKDALCQIWLKLAQCFWRRGFLNSVNVFSLFQKFSPLRKGRSPSFIQNWILITQRCFVPSLVEIGSVVQEKKIFFNFVNVFLLFIWTNLNPLYLRVLCAKFGWFWRRRWKCWKFTTTTTTTTTKDNGQILIRKAHLSLRLWWANNVHWF